MANTGFKVLVDELTVHKAVRQLNHPITGEPMGWQQGAGETWFLDEVIPPEQMNPEWVEALESGEGEMYEALSTKLEPSSDEPALNEQFRMGLPFEGYDDMDEEDILAAMRVLPSAAVQRMKDWEATKGDDAREAIVDFNIGYGESPDDRQSGRLSPGESDEVDDTKPVRAIQTRDGSEEGEPVVHGEGVTGTGEPQVAHGTAAKKSAKRAAGGGRAGRRPRPTTKKAPESGSSGSGSSTT